MRSPRSTAIVAVTAAAVLAGASQAAAHPRCVDVGATIYDKVVTEGCPPGVPVCVVGVVRGKHGFKGTTVFVLGSRGETPPTAPDQRPVSGTLTYTFEDGSTLTALETSIGNVDPETGTGRYLDATGFAYLAQHFEDDHFVTRIEGQVCHAGR